MNHRCLRSLKLTLLFAFSITATSAFARLAPEETCRKAGEALIGQNVEGAYLDSFTLNDTDAGAILQLSELFRGPGAQREALGSLGGALQLNPNNPRFALALAKVEKAVPIQRIGLQTTCRIAGLAAGQIQFKPDRSSKESREVQGVPVVMTITAAGSSSGVEVLQGDHAIAFQEAASEFEKSLRLRSAQAQTPTQGESSARTEIPRLGQVEPPMPQLPPPSISPPPPPRIGTQQGATATAQTPSDFPLADGTYLPTQARCSSHDIDDDRDARRYIAKGGNELRFREGSCRRISHGPNSEGIGVVWKCEVEGDAQTIYQTIKPVGQAFEISEWLNQLRGAPKKETYERCAAVALLKFGETTPVRSALASPSRKQPTLAYGSRSGMEADVIRSSGVDTASARIVIRHSRRNAASYCTEYLSDTSAACIDQKMRAVKLQSDVRGNCVNGDFLTATGARFRFLGPDTATPGQFRISDSTGRVLDGSAGSGHDVALSTFRALCPTRLNGSSATQPQPSQRTTAAAQAQTPVRSTEASRQQSAQPAACPFDGRWSVQIEASCARFRSTAIVENCKIVRGGHLRNASGSIDPSTGAVAYRVAASADEGTPGGSGTGTLRRDQSGNGKITLGPGCEGSMRWWRE